jgi:ubiquitin-protein ligase
VSFLAPQKELKEIDHDKASGVTADIVGDNLQHLIGSVPGPKDTPYEGGLFRVDIQLDAQYPFAPPKMRFMTRVWHPNVSSANGAICLGEADWCVDTGSPWVHACSVLQKWISRSSTHSGAAAGVLASAVSAA